MAAAWRDAAALLKYPVAVGVDGYYYVLQVKQLLNTGHLHFSNVIYEAKPFPTPNFPTSQLLNFSTALPHKCLKPLFCLKKHFD